MKPDISELYSKVHKLSEAFNKIEVEKPQGQDCYQLHIYWKNGRVSVSSSALEENGKRLTISVVVDITEYIYNEPTEFTKEKHEVVNIPLGVGSVVLGRWNRVGEPLMNGFEAGIR